MDIADSLLERARSLESSGQDQAALDLYARVAAEAARPDAALLVRMGNLQLRLGRTDEAAASFSRSAELLAGAGLPNGAIALWRRVLRVQPDAPATLLRLAQLDAREGYAREAREGLARYADQMERAGDPDAGLDALRAHLDAFPGDAGVRHLLAERLEALGRAGEVPGAAPGSASPAPPAPEPAAEAEPEESLEVLGSGWEGAELPASAGPMDAPGIDLVPTRLGDTVDEGDVAPLAGLEPTRMEGLEPTSLDPGPPPDEPPPADDEPLALLGSDPDAGPELDLSEEHDEPLPLLGTDPAVEEQDSLMRDVEDAVRSGDEERTIEALLALGRHLDAAGQVVRAKEVFGRVLELAPDHEEARRARGDLDAG